MHKALVKKKKSTPHLDFYKKCMKDEARLPFKYDITRMNGLCSATLWENPIDAETLNLFEPNAKDIEWLEWEDHNTSYWGSDHYDTKEGEFTTLRQTIVLFMAAMNGEL